MLSDDESISLAVIVTVAIPSLYCTVWDTGSAETTGASFTGFTVMVTLAMLLSAVPSLAL